MAALYIMTVGGNMDIGLIGLAGSGKDSLAELLASSKGYDHRSFAETLKKVCREIGWNGLKDARGRKLLQDVGSVFREYDPHIWIDCANDLLCKQNRDGESKPVVWSDVRFPNEAEYIRNKRDGIIIRIVRSTLELKELHEHVSEKGQKDIRADYTIFNDTTKEDMYSQCLSIIESYEQKQYRQN